MKKPFLYERGFYQRRRRKVEDLVKEMRAENRKVFVLKSRG